MDRVRCSWLHAGCQEATYALVYLCVWGVCARWFRQDDYVAISMERFSAAQGSGYGMGLGLEDASAQASPSINPARDFQVCTLSTLSAALLPHASCADQTSHGSDAVPP